MVKKDLCFLQMSEIGGSLRPTTWPSVPHPPLGGKRGWKRGGDCRDPPLAPASGPTWPYLVKSLVQSNSQGTAGATRRLTGAFPRQQEAQEFSTRGLGSAPGHEAGPHLGCTTVDEVIRRGPGDERCSPLWCLPQP